MPRPRFTDAHEKIFEVAKNAWTLSDDQLAKLKPGPAGVQNAINMLSLAEYQSANRLSSLVDMDNLHIDILKTFRDPLWFPFTCRNLFSKPDGSGPLELLPFQHVVLLELWWRQFPMFVATRGAGKSFLLALYALLRATFTPGSRIIITAAAFRQAKAVFEYMERIWYGSPVFRTLVNSGQGGNGRKNGPRRDIDRVEFVIGDSVVIGLPIGTGEKIRGLRANYILTDEVAALNEDVYAVVVQGFASVTADPVGNVKDYARIRLLKILGLWNADMDAEEAKRVRGNQSVLSGTAYYSFNHFCRYWKEYKSIIETGGDKKKLEEVMRGVIPEGFNANDYSVTRLPYELIPHGYMDQKTISRAKQITNTLQFGLEYQCIFASDSEGFFKRSLIESCTVGKSDHPNPPSHPSAGGKVSFTATVNGDQARKYVYGVDPASERDQFAIVVLEMWPDHHRVVYTWTTSKSDHRKRIKNKTTADHDFYRYCVRKIRNLMKTFPCERLLVDHGGGGIALREALGDPDKLEPGEYAIHELVDDKKPKDSDDLPGLKILEMVVFRNNAWVAEANHGLKKDMESHAILFPNIDPLALGMAEAEDEHLGRVSLNEAGEKVWAKSDTLESCMLEIEELKSELACIVLTSTSTGLEHWDTPDKKMEGTATGRMRKDRYSALLMANMGARQIARTIIADEYTGVVGGFATHLVEKNRKKGEQAETFMFKGNQQYRNAVGGGGWYGAVVKRGGV